MKSQTTQSMGSPVRNVATRHDTIHKSDSIEQVVFELNAICKAATLDFAMSVGGLIIRRFYDNDLAAWRHRGRKLASFRKLSRHPDLPMSPGALYRSVAIFEICERLGIREWRHVSSSHLRAVIAVPNERQAELLNAAEGGRWSVRRLEEEIDALNLRHTTRSRGGRRRSNSPFQRLICTLDNCAVDVSRLNELKEEGDGPSPESAQLASNALLRVRQVCLLIERQLTKYLTAAQNGTVPCEIEGATPLGDPSARPSQPSR